MGIPAEAATQGELETADNKDFEKAVLDVVKQITRGKDGKYVLPEGVTPEVKQAAIFEQRRRDTQAEYTRVTQANKALEVENNILKQKVKAEAKVELTKEQAEELEELKFSDPEAWRKQMNKLEREAAANRESELKAEIAKISTETLDKDNLERRKEILEEFNQAHPDFLIDDDVLANDIPPRFLKKLETGEVSFEAFLKEVYEYATTGKVVKQESTMDQPNLGKIGGNSTPDKLAQKEDLIMSYKKEIF